MAHMLGKFCPTGPGGRDCTCCGQAPGKNRRKARRQKRAQENAAWKRGIVIWY